MTPPLTFPARRPLLAILPLLLLTLLAAWQLPRLQFDIGPQEAEVPEGPAGAAYRETKRQFGNDRFSLVYLEDPALFTADKLARIDHLERRLSALPFIERTRSLFNAPVIQPQENGARAIPLLADIPGSAAQLQAIRRSALANPRLAGELIGRDGRGLAIQLFFRAGAHTRGDGAHGPAIDELLAPLQGEFARVFQFGPEKARLELTRRLWQAGAQWLPPALLLLFLIPALLLQRPNAALIPMVVTGMGLIWTLGLMAAIGIPANPLTLIAPLLAVLYGTANSLQLLDGYMVGIRGGLGRFEAMSGMLRNRRSALALLSLVAALGFLSLALSYRGALLDLALAGAAGLAFSLLIALLVGPALLAVMGESKVDSGVQYGPAQLALRRWTAQLLHLTLTHRPVAWTLLGLAALLALAGSARLQVDSDARALWRTDAGLAAEMGTLQRDLAGTRSFSIVLDSGVEDTFDQVRYLGELRRIQHHLDDLGGFGKTLSLADLVHEAHRALSPTRGGSDLPDDDDQVRAYLKRVPASVLTRFVSADYRQARVLVHHDIGSARDINNRLARLRTFLDAEVDPVMQIRISGESVLAGQGLTTLTRQGLLAVLVFAAALWLLVALHFFNPWAGLVPVLSLLPPLLALFGMLGAAGIPLDAAALPLLPLALGLGLIPVLQQMARQHREWQRRRAPGPALTRGSVELVLPIAAGGLGAAVALATLGAADFAPLARFGWLGATLALTVLLSAFTLGPLLLGRAESLTLWDLMTLKTDTAALQASPLFRGLSRRQIRQVLLTGEVRRIPRDNGIGPGQLGPGEVLVLLQGRAEFRGSRQEDDESPAPDGWQPGELLSAQDLPQESEVRIQALEDLQVMSVDWRRIDHLARAYPTLALRLYRNLGQVAGSPQDQAERIPDQFYLGDPTGLYGREFLAGRMEQEIRRAVRDRTPLAFLSLQVGLRRDGVLQPLTEAPDAVFQRVVTTIQTHIREVDMVARWNHGNPAILLPNTDAEQAAVLARRIAVSLQQEFRGEAWQLEITSRCRRLDDADSAAEPRLLSDTPA